MLCTVNTNTFDIHSFLATAGGSFVPFGPASANDDSAQSPSAKQAPSHVQLIETFDEYHAEYAAIRKSVGILDQPQRGLVVVTGKDRAEFLHRMITHDTRTLEVGQARRAFLLSKQGRITADMIVLHEADRSLIALDRFQAGDMVRELDKYIFSEEVKLVDQSSAFHQISLHGPNAFKLIAHLTGTAFEPLEVMRHASVTMDGASCTIYRRDDAGSPGLHLILPVDTALNTFTRMAQAVGGLVPNISQANDDNTDTRSPDTRPPIKGRGIGWLAFNTARIEAGTPLYNIDFGPDSLPGESAQLEDAVSFTKGCYLGQEIVARMQHLGHPKRIIVGLRMEADRLPIAGSPVHELDSPGGTVIGGITSSTLSPLLGNTAIALATMKWAKRTPGTQVLVPAEGAFVKATVCELPFVGK